MLVHLHVRNLALIEDIEVEFGPGLNILTGETGAGKSILLGSMQLILGGRSAKDMIRTGASNALVELLFQVENPRAEASLRELGVETSEGQVLLTRKLMDGRSINKINGETCTVAQMKAAASCLLDIHGQHEHQSLLYQDKQLEILDIYGKEEIFPAKEKVQTAYKKYRDCKRQLDELDIDEEQRNRERALLEFEINEIESAQLVSGEDEELEKLYRKLNNGRKILETLQGVRDLTGYESGQGAGESVGNAVREISRVTEYDTQLDSMASALQEIDGLLNDFNRELASYVDDLNFDDEALTLDEEGYLCGATGCGLCALYALQRAGITHLKLVGRGNHADFMEKDIRNLRKALDILEGSSSEADFRKEMKRQLFPRGCSGNCYYAKSG